jgi:hypothetical protein
VFYIQLSEIKGESMVMDSPFFSDRRCIAKNPSGPHLPAAGFLPAPVDFRVESKPDPHAAVWLPDA